MSRAGSPRLNGEGGGNNSSSGGSPRLEQSGGGGVPSRHIGSVKDDWPMYSAQASDYVLGPSIGFGASSVVYQASFLPLNGRACAVKVIDLEAFGRDIAELRRETQLMSLSKHPNVLRVRGCWVEGSKLHIASRLMSSGSMLDIMRFSYPEGFEEGVIATVLQQSLQGLNYLHMNNWLHRDLKAANMLVDDDGTVLLGDFGVGVFLDETSKPYAKIGEKKVDSWSEGPRKSFVGTPCWMAPEVVERKGYGVKADIWSFGITALELSSGRAPHSRLAPVKILMKTLKEEPPTLDRVGNAHKYSKLFDDFVRQCLQKDPAKRPSAEKLLQHGFFKQAKQKKFLVSTILSGLPPLSDRQDRRRAMSIASLQNNASWDFSSASIASKLNTPALENKDPFLNFSASFANPASPNGSIRSNRIMSLDGQYAFTHQGEESDFKSMVEAWKSPFNSAKRLSGNFAMGGARSAGGVSSRPVSTDFSSMIPVSESWGRKGRHRQGSVSFDLGDEVAEISEVEKVIEKPNLPVIEEHKSNFVKAQKLQVQGTEKGNNCSAPSTNAINTSPTPEGSTSTSEGADLKEASLPPPKTKELGGALSKLFRRI